MDDDDTQEIPIIPQTYPLTERLQQECDRFARVMAEAPDSLLYECLVTPRARKHPQRWID